MKGETFAAIAVAVLSLAGSAFASAQARRANRDSVDAQAFKRAQSIYEGGIVQLEDQLKFLRRTLESEQADNGALRVRVGILERLVSRMRQELITAGIDVAGIAPPEPAATRLGEP